jgi:hypothetical protein
MSSARDALERARALQPAGFEPDPLEDELAPATRAARLELERWRRDNPRHAAWIAAGARPIRSEAEHVAIFGIVYEKPTVKRRRK